MVCTAQISTDEVILLPSNSCCGYSWRNYKTVEQVGPTLVCHPYPPSERLAFSLPPAGACVSGGWWTVEVE